MSIVTNQKAIYGSGLLVKKRWDIDIPIPMYFIVSGREIFAARGS